jgi:hypothetical protein
MVNNYMDIRVPRYGMFESGHRRGGPSLPLSVKPGYPEVTVEEMGRLDGGAGAGPYRPKLEDLVEDEPTPKVIPFAEPVSIAKLCEQR